MASSEKYLGDLTYKSWVEIWYNVTVEGQKYWSHWDRSEEPKGPTINSPNSNVPELIEKKIWLKKQLARRRCSDKDNRKGLGGSLLKVEDAGPRKVEIAIVDKKNGKLPRKADITYLLNALHQLSQSH